MRSFPLAVPLLCACAGLFACKNPDNLVVGVGAAAPNQPGAYINTVQSAISGIATVYDAHGVKTSQQVSVVVLSDKPGLCQMLAQHPDYFRNAPQTNVSLLLFAPPDRSGTFYIGGGAGIFAELVPADGPDSDGGTPTTVDGGLVYTTAPFPSTQGQISFQQFDVRVGGQAAGSFDVILLDANTNGVEYYGKFKTQVCDALSTAIVP